MRKSLAEATLARPYFMGDFYPLTSYSLGNDVWLAFQMHRPDLRGQEFGHRGAGVRIEQKDPHGALAWREPAGRPGDGRHEAGLRW